MNNLFTNRVVYVYAAGPLTKILYFNEDCGNVIYTYLQSVARDLDNGLGSVRCCNHEMERIFREVILVKLGLCYYRAILLAANSPSTSYTVFLIDQGITITAKLSDIRLMRVPMAQEEGILHGVEVITKEWTPEKQLYVNNIVSKNFLETCAIRSELPVSLMKVTVNSKIDLSAILISINVVSPIEDECQKSLITKSLSSVNTSCDLISYCYAAGNFEIERFSVKQLEVGKTVDAYVTHVSDGPASFYIMLKNDYEITYPLIRKKIGSLKVGRTSYPIQQGQVCLAHDFAGTLHRGIVIGIKNNEACVYFVDLGYNRFVHFREIYEMPKELIVPKALAINVKLVISDEELITEDVKNLFSALFRNSFQPVVLQIMSISRQHKQMVEVFLEQDNGELKSIKEKLFRPAYPKIVLLSGKTYKVILSHYNSLNAVSVRLADQENTRNLVTSQLQTYSGDDSASASVLLESLYEGMPVCAKYTDYRWARAAILNDTNTAQDILVRFVDYGNEKSVNLEAIKEMHPNLNRFPAQAISCIIPQRIVGLDENENVLLNTYLDSMVNKTFNMTVVKFNSNGIPVVQLVDENGTHVVDSLKHKLHLCINKKHFRKDDLLEKDVRTDNNKFPHNDESPVIPKDEFHQQRRRNLQLSIRISNQRGIRTVLGGSNYAKNRV